MGEAHGKSPLFDDALWEAARLAEAARDWPAALDHYRRILATRERSLFIGSYHSRYLDDAQVAAGRLLRDALGDPRGAARELEKVERDYPTSTLRDDALWELALAWQQAGDTARACAALARLEARFPESRHELDEAPALARQLGCTGPVR